MDIGPYVVAAIAVLPGVLAYRQSKQAQSRTQDLELKKIDAEAYERAMEIWKAALKSAEDEIVRLSTIVKAQRADAEFAEARITLLEKEVRKLRILLNLPVDGV